MRALYLVTNFHLIGGKEQYDRNFIKTLSEAGIKVHIVMLGGRNFFRKSKFLIQFFLEWFKGHWDFVFCAHLSFAPLCFFLGKIRRLRYSVIVHGIEAWNIKSSLKKKALREASAIITVSNYTKGKILEQLEGKRDVYIIPNSIDGALFKIIEKSRELLLKHAIGDSKVILTVSRLYPQEPEKGYYRVIDALPIIKKTFPAIRYIIVGSGASGFGDARDYIRKYAKEKGVGDDVILAGRVSNEELVKYYNLCDVFVMPSKEEGFGIVFLEALACGRPVIAGNKDASSEAILDGELGILVNPENTEDIAQGILKILEKDVPGRLLNREFLRKRVLEEYGIDKFKARVREVVKLIS